MVTAADLAWLDHFVTSIIPAGATSVEVAAARDILRRLTQELYEERGHPERQPEGHEVDLRLDAKGRGPKAHERRNE